jgi:hypothetical protein
MKIMVIMRKEFAGCGFYRMYQPHNHLAKNYLVDVLITNGIGQFTDDQLKNYDIAIWQKSYFSIEDVQRVRNLGVITIADLVLSDKNSLIQIANNSNSSDSMPVSISSKTTRSGLSNSI